MALKEQLKSLTSATDSPCVTISLNTHRTHPDNLQDEILLKNLLKEAEERIIEEYGKRPAAILLDKISTVGNQIDINYNLDSLHIFLSETVTEIIKSPWPSSNEGVHISDTFAVRSIIKTYNRSESYLIMVLSQKGINLFEALNDSIIDEIKNEDFPFPANNPPSSNSDRTGDSKFLDNIIREYYNQADKALIKVVNQTSLKCVVISTDNNLSYLNEVTDQPSVYIGHANLDYNNSSEHQIAEKAWEVIKEIQFDRRTKAINEIKEAVGQGKVITDLQEIYQAAIDSRGDILIVHQDFTQPVVMIDERTFKIIDEPTSANAIDDITSNIAWEVLSKNGTVYFTSQDEIKELGKIALKTRY